MSSLDWSYVVWGAWFLVGAILEILGLFDVVPWRSLSTTAWSVESLGTWIKVLVLIGLLVLTTHIVFRWP